jgi:hypothetical protein
MILYCKDILGCIDNNNIELINNYLYHYVTVITMWDARSKSFSFASVATATQIILVTLPLYSQNATGRSSTANTDINFQL